MPQVTINLNATRAIQTALGAGALAAGWTAGNTLVRDTFLDDLVGHPTRTVDVADGFVVTQDRAARGEALSKALIGIGAIGAAVGGVLALGPGAGGEGMRAALRTGSGGVLMAAGVGLIGSTISAAARYGNAEARRP